MRQRPPDRIEFIGRLKAVWYGTCVADDDLCCGLLGSNCSGKQAMIVPRR